MALKQGERYRCPESDCECEIQVTISAGPSGGDENPRCCCGTEMERVGQAAPAKA